jgi:sulfate transport system ATP-binding protein
MAAGRVSVTVKNLKKRFASGELPAVNDVSFVAPAGAITSLLGPSGSGKTTVLRMIAGLEEPDSGTVAIEDQECTRTPVQQRGVGFVFQGYALFEHLDVRGNVAFGLRLKKVPKGELESRVDELLALVQLGDLGKRLPGQLSGGQRQRVAFARALATKPRVLLLDEPFGALDTRVRFELRDWLGELNQKTKVTTVLVTHDQDEALELSKQVIVMNEGQVAQAGAPNHVYDHPASPFVASFIGNANILRGQILGGKASVGPSLNVTAPDGAVDGEKLNAFVRPNDVKLAKPTDSGSGSLSLARIEAILRIGGHVRVNLRLPSDERMTVHLRVAELEQLGLGEGDRVLVDIGGAKVFMGDYSI